MITTKGRYIPRRRTTDKPPPDGLPDRITTGQLQSPGELAALFQQYKGRVSEFDFFALAVRAVRKGKNPPATFRWLLHNSGTQQITIAEEDEARQMLRANRSQRSPWLQNIVNKMLAGKKVPRPYWRMTDHEMNQRRNEVLRQLEEIELGCTNR